MSNEEVDDCHICLARGVIERIRIPEAEVRANATDRPEGLRLPPWAWGYVNVCTAVCSPTLKRLPGAGRPFEPRGFRRGGDWIYRDALAGNEASVAVERAESCLKRLLHDAKCKRPRQTFERAFARVKIAVHQASRFGVYVGRAGATTKHLKTRFARHSQDKGAVYIRPVIAVPNALAKEEHWEQRMIAWTAALSARNDLCCKNLTAYDDGNWPKDEDFSVIYVAACGGSDLDPSKSNSARQRDLALRQGIRFAGQFVQIDIERLRFDCHRRSCLDGPNFTGNMCADGKTDRWFETAVIGGVLRGWNLTAEGARVARVRFPNCSHFLLRHGVGYELAAESVASLKEALTSVGDYSLRRALSQGHMGDGRRHVLVVPPSESMLRSLEEALSKVARGDGPAAREALRLLQEVRGARLDRDSPNAVAGRPDVQQSLFGDEHPGGNTVEPLP